MPLYTKSTSGWTSVKSFWVKTYSGWTTAKQAWIKSVSGWIQFWPKSGPYTKTSPYFSTDAAGNNQPSGFTLNTGSTIYLQKGIWNSNGSNITSYRYEIYTSAYQSNDAGTLVSSGNITNYVSINLSYVNYDDYYIYAKVIASRSDGVSGKDTTDSNGYRYFVLKQYAPTPKGATTSGTTNVGNQITFTSNWYGDSNHSPDSYRSNVNWYSSSFPLSDPTQGTQLYNYVINYYPTNNGTTYSVISKYTLQSSDVGQYIYAVNTEQNSYTDYYYGYNTGITQIGYFGQVVSNPPSNISAPYFELISGVGNTVGDTYRLHFGSWTNSPTYYMYEIYQNNLAGTVLQQDLSGTYTNNYVDITFNSTVRNAIYGSVKAGNAGGASNFTDTPTSIGPIHMSIQPFNYSLSNVTAPLIWPDTGDSYSEVPMQSISYSPSINNYVYRYTWNRPNNVGYYTVYVTPQITPYPPYTYMNSNQNRYTYNPWYSESVSFSFSVGGYYSFYVYAYETTGTVRVTWDYVPGASYYQVFYYNTNDYVIQNQIVNGTYIDITQPAPTTVYVYDIKAYDDTGYYMDGVSNNITQSLYQQMATGAVGFFYGATVSSSGSGGGSGGGGSAPSTPNFSYFYGDANHAFGAGGINIQASGATSYNYTLYRTGNGTGTSGHGNFNTYVQVGSGTLTPSSTGGNSTVYINTADTGGPRNGYYYVYATATNSYGTSSGAYSNAGGSGGGQGQTGTVQDWMYY